MNDKLDPQIELKYLKELDMLIIDDSIKMFNTLMGNFQGNYVSKMGQYPPVEGKLTRVFTINISCKENYFTRSKIQLALRTIIDLRLLNAMNEYLNLSFERSNYPKIQNIVDEINEGAITGQDLDFEMVSIFDRRRGAYYLNY